MSKYSNSYCSCTHWLTKLSDLQWSFKPFIATQVGEVCCVVLFCSCLWQVKQQCSWQEATPLRSWQHISPVVAPLALHLKVEQKGNAYFVSLNEVRSSSEPWQCDLWQLVYGNRLWIKLLRGVPTAEMSGQCGHIQTDFNCSLPVSETGYSLMGCCGLCACWVRTEVLAAMAILGPAPKLGYGVCILCLHTFLDVCI